MITAILGRTGLNEENARQLEEFDRMLSLSREWLSFAVVECNSLAVRDQFLEELNHRHPDLFVRSVPLDTTDVLDYMIAEADAAGVSTSPSAVVLLGLEESVSMSQVDSPSLKRLNYSRDHWGERFRCPVIFWLPEYAVIALSRTAHDLWRMVSHRFTLVYDPRFDTAALPRALSSLELESLDSFKRPTERRVRELESQADVDFDFGAADVDSGWLKWSLDLTDAYLENSDLEAAKARVDGAIAEVSKRIASGELSATSLERVVCLQKQGELRQRLRDSEGALRAFEIATRTVDQLLADHPENVKAMPVSVKLRRQLGDLYLTLGRIRDAEPRYREALAIAERLAAGEPERADYQRDLSVSYNRMGDLYSALGDDAGAREAYGKSLLIRERLAAGEPERADYQRDLSVSYDKMGDMYSASGDGAGAREAYGKSLLIMERLAAGEPERADYERDLSVSYNKMGDMYGALGDGAGAREAYEKSLSIRERLAAGEPERADHQVDLVISLYKTATSEKPADRRALERGLAILLFLQQTGRLSPDRVPLIEMFRTVLK